MNAKSTCACSSEMQGFLDGSLSPQRLTALEEHLSTCEACLQVMHDLAGDTTWWSDVELALGDDPTLNDFSVADEFAKEEDEQQTSLPLRGILELLGPTDDPQFIGRIGPYEIAGLVGQGGMGAVFKAFDVGLNRYVAIKVLLPHLSASGAAKARFRREGQAAAAVVNDHVLPIYVVDQYQGTPYLVMQYIRGTTLQKRLSTEGPLPPNEILRIALHAARGLAAAHEQGLVHRDVKPSNILLQGGVDRAILSDFGLARAADDASLTRSGMLAGTPQFMSPEQVLGDRLDQRSDLFSLGSVIYAMCTGHPPFRAESSYAVLRRITDQAPRPIREINPAIPYWLEQLAMWLMAKKPVDRPQTATSVALLLQQCLAHLEQPHSVSLPNVLQKSQVTNTRIIWKKSIMSISAVAFMSALAWGSFSLLTDDPDPQANTKVEETTTESADEPGAKMKGSTTVNGFRVSLVGVGELGDITESVTRFRPRREDFTTNQASSSFSSNQFSNTQSFNNNGSSGGSSGFGSTSSGGGGGGFTGGGGASFGNTFTKPNFGMAIEITETGSKGKGKNQKHAVLGSAVKIVELDGTEEEAQDSGPISTTWPRFDRQFPGTSGLYVHRTKDPEVPLKEIHGELKISSGMRLEAVFPGTEQQQKKVNGEVFALKSVQETQGGLNVVVSFPPTSAMKKSRNMLEKMQAAMTSLQSYELEIEDKEGNIIVPSGSSATGSGGGGSQGTSFNGRTQSRSSQTEPDLTTMTFHFQSLPIYSITSITARVVESDGEVETVPFTIQVETE